MEDLDEKKEDIMKVYCSTCRYLRTWEGAFHTHYRCKANRVLKQDWSGRAWYVNGNAEKINCSHDCPKFEKGFWRSIFPAY